MGELWTKGENVLIKLFQKLALAEVAPTPFGSENLDTAQDFSASSPVATGEILIRRFSFCAYIAKRKADKQLDYIKDELPVAVQASLATFF